VRPPPPAGRSRPRFLPVLLAIVAGGASLAGLAIGSVALPSPLTTSAAASSAISLVDDDGGVALFPGAELSPGRVDTACVGLTAGGSADPTTEVQLSADVRSGDLAPYLQVSIERGSVPAGGNCGSFAGEQIWHGTLDQLPGPGVAGIPTGWRPALVQRSVYRFTVSVVDDPHAQGRRAAASFRWSVTEAGPAPIPEPTPEPSPPPTPQPTLAPPVARASDPESAGTNRTTAAVPVASTTPDASGTATETSATPAAPSADPPVPGAGGSAGGTDVVEAPPVKTGSPAAQAVEAVQAAVKAVAQAVAQAAVQVGQTAGAVAHDGQFPLALVGVVAAFLFLQGRLDRRDPKLALARVREELSEYRDFPEPPTTETT
jgi:hypothetical protein